MQLFTIGYAVDANFATIGKFLTINEFFSTKLKEKTILTSHPKPDPETSVA